MFEGRWSHTILFMFDVEFTSEYVLLGPVRGLHFAHWLELFGGSQGACTVERWPLLYRMTLDTFFALPSYLR